MSKYLLKSSVVIGLGLSIPTTLSANVARSQAKNNPEEDLPTGSTAADVNRQIQKALPIQVAPSQSPSTAITAGNYTFVLSTPATIAIVVVIGSIALFPVLSLILSSKKIAQLSQSKFLPKLGEKFQKPQVLGSDKFLHQRSVNKLAEITNRAENLNADKFGNSEFTAFFRIKSYIARSMDEYANLDETIELLKVGIAAQKSFALIDSTESRYCSGGQQQLYKFVNSLLTQEIETASFKEQVHNKLQEVLPLLKTETGKEALQAYVTEVNKISEHKLGMKLILLFKKYQLNDYSTLRSVSDTINLLESEDLLNLDALLLLVMVKYDVFEKLGPIVGIEEQYNRPETYSKMLQYIGLKSRHESSYQKFQEFLLLLKEWEIHYRSVVNVRNKYSEHDYHIPKEFTAEVPGFELYQKYKDSFHLITSVTPPTIATAPDPVDTAETTAPVDPESMMVTEVPIPVDPESMVVTEVPIPVDPESMVVTEVPVPVDPELMMATEAPVPAASELMMVIEAEADSIEPTSATEILDERETASV
jgi:hypothetical protein